ncbi:methyltransferase-like protein 27 [Apostichopus japonicus]|uniref:methyltransferase-like protein 27 n=1 Tax=Stichopus japonicus TaxID=307972 RepID=UPI003AB32DCA
MSSSEKGETHISSQGKRMFNIIKQDKDISSQEIANLYDDWATSFEKDNVKLNYRGPHEMSSVLAEFGNSKDVSVLDVGSGTGLLGEALKALGFTNVSALDISQKSLDFSEKKGIYKKLFCVDVGTDGMPFNDNEFDVLACCGGIVPNHISPVAIEEWTRIVKQGGIIVLSIRRCYIEIMQGQEELYSKKLAEKCDEVLEDLKNTKKVEVTLKKEVPYLENSPAVIYVLKVL